MKKSYITIALLAFLLFQNVELFSQDKGSCTVPDLKTGFETPPPEAKARTWWHWINGNVSKKGITADLEAMKRVGIQEFQLFNVALNFPKGPVDYLSDEWLDLFHFAAKEAKRLDLEMAFHNGAGWSSSGGPWVTPEYAMQTVVFSEISVQGSQNIKKRIPQPESKFDYYQDIAVLAFPKPKQDIKIDNLDYKNLSERIRNHLLPDTKDIPEDAIISSEAIVDVSSKMSEDGILEWNVPQGEWIILRIGHTPIGTKNRPAPEEGSGLEVDKMSKKAVDEYWKGGVQPIIDKLGDLIGTTVNNCLIDSYEVETTNWTTGFDTEFERLRGYDLFSYLPTMAGYYVNSGEISERFLWDFRRTIGDLIAENYYAHFGELLHQNGMKFSVEPYWGPFDNMQVGATGDIVMCEFWSGGYPFFDSPKFVSSIAHLNGSSIVGAESFTGVGGWDEHPAQLKSIGDRAWAEGITRFIFHSYVHQPYDVAPGLALGYFGTDFNRLNTWWDQSKAFMDYIARSQYLLQQGKSVADVLVFTGESSPNTAFLKPEIKTMGYDYDVIGANKLKDLFVENGIIRTPVGGGYKVLVLPPSDWAKPETLQKVKELVDAGGKVIGSRPSKSPSLTNYPDCDDEVENLANTLWSEGAVKDISIEEFLNKHNQPADFSIENEDDSDISFIHRKTDDADIYFIANARKESREITGRFRISGKQPELWNAETGTTKDHVVYRENSDGTTTVPLSLGMEESVFIIFKKPTTKQHLLETEMELEKPALEPLSNLKITKAEFGTFLQEGLVDITDNVAKGVKDGLLDIQISRSICDCDPAMGYKKKVRIEYQIGETTHQLVAEEREHIRIDAGDVALKISKAVFGKFKPETKGVPKYYPTYNITEKIKDLVASGSYDIPVTDQLIENKKPEGDKTALKITFTTDGEERTVIIPEGQTLKLSKDKSKSDLVVKGEKIHWITPNAGTLTYTNLLGETKTMHVKSVPEPMEIAGPWEVTFPTKLGTPEKANFDVLLSWTEADEKGIQHFSGTVTYSKEFVLPKSFLQSDTSLELDLGSVAVIAEVIINGKNAGTLWKAPFRVNIDEFVTKGTNTLEVKVTNLWPNRLIGDESLSLDYERNGNKTKAVPEWLNNNTERSSERTTFSSWKHWNADDTLLTSGLLGPVRIIPFKKLDLN
ncbi:MAG: glycosyl hydrolase [Flavobacteriaceae bacterium]